jgi:hypothetical protein
MNGGIKVENIIERISSYNILNFLFPGAFCIFIFNIVFDINIISINILESFLYYYLVGLILSRLGSLVISTIIKRLNLISEAPYEDYIYACKQDSKIEILVETCNSYRTYLSASFFALVISIVLHTSGLLHSEHIIIYSIILVLLNIMFFYSYKKQSNFIKKRVIITKKEGN